MTRLMNRLAGTPKDLMSPSNEDLLVNLSIEPGLKQHNRGAEWYVQALQTTEEDVERIVEWFVGSISAGGFGPDGETGRKVSNVIESGYRLGNARDEYDSGMAINP